MPSITNNNILLSGSIRGYQGITLLTFFVLLLYTFVIAYGSLESFPSSMSTGFEMPYLADKPVGEDGYYMLTVAWNIASGHGIAIRPGEPTTGIQPLATFIYASIAKIIILLGGDKFDLVSWVIIFGGINQIFFAVIMGKVTLGIANNIVKHRHSAISRAIVAIIIATSFYLFRAFTYGLETGIYLSLFALLIYLSLKVFSSINNQTISRLVVVGLVAGMTALARIDFGVIFAIFLLILIFFKKIHLRQAIILGLTALTVVLPWLVWVKLVSGHWIPSSGIAQSSLIDSHSLQYRAYPFLSAITQNIFPSLFTGGRSPLVAIAALPTIIAIYLMISISRSWKSADKPIWIAWLLGSLLMILLYPVFFWATHFYARYTSPLLVVVMPLFSVAVTSIALKARFICINPKRTIAFFAIFLVSLNAALATFSLHTGKIGNSHSVSAGYVREYLSSSSTVGAFQSGVIGYFNDNVINLDGKVNPGVIDALAKGGINDYVLARNIDYVIDWSGAINSSFLTVPNAERYWRKCQHVVPNDASLCIQRIR